MLTKSECIQRKRGWQEDEEVATPCNQSLSLSLTLSLDPVPFPSSYPYSLPPSWRMKLHVTSSSSFYPFYPTSYIFVLLDLLSLTFSSPSLLVLSVPSCPSLTLFSLPPALFSSVFLPFLNTFFSPLSVSHLHFMPTTAQHSSLLRIAVRHKSLER